MDKLSKHGKIMEKFRGLIPREKKCAAVIDKTQLNWIKNLDAAIERTNKEFFVVVMGNFSAGKSTNINALIGEKVLPSYPTPTTAVMTELRYGEDKKIIMYPKKGENIDGHGDKPFEVPATEEAIEKYITIDNDAGINSKPIDSVKIASKFEKMELYWPLEMLKNGVVIVDSPGLNDPYSNDAIVKNYLPKADAIIYTLNSTNPYQLTDKNELTSLNEFGIRNIIFAYTYWDMVRDSGEKAVKKSRDYCVQNALNHTDLGESAVHFLASKEGLHARIEKDDDLWISSGYKEYEAFLQEYLTTRKGKDKVNNIVATIESQAEAMKKQAVILDENAQKDKKLIEQNISIANDKLAELKKDAKTIHSTFELKLETKKPYVKDVIKSGLCGLKDKIDLDDFTPNTEFRTGWARLNPFGKNEIAKKIAEEFQTEYNARIKKELLKYQSTTVADTLQSAITYAAESIESDVESLARAMDDIDISIGMPYVDSKQKGHGGNPLLGITYGLFTGDWLTGGSIAVYGGAGRQIGLQFGTAAGLGVAIALGAPITVPIAVVALIAANIVAIFAENNQKRVNNIRKETLAQLRKAYFEDGEDKFIEPTTDSIMVKVDEIFEEASGYVMHAISSSFSEKQKVFESMRSQANMDRSEQDKLVNERKKAVDELDNIVAEAKALQADY